MLDAMADRATLSRFPWLPLSQDAEMPRLWLCHPWAHWVQGTVVKRSPSLGPGSSHPDVP